MPAYKTLLNWSSGKDATMALSLLLEDSNYQVDGLVTTVNGQLQRVSMHGLRNELLRRQVQSIGIPHTTIELPEMPTMEVYETEMHLAFQAFKKQGFSHAAFGDLFLEDLKKYREQQFQKLEFELVFPLWKKDTSQLITEFIQSGYKAIVVAANSELGESFVGRELDESFIQDLPSHIDPCGENGEFHTFCYDGPIFRKPIQFTIGDKVFKEYENPSSDSAHANESKVGFWFCDLIP